MQSFLKARGFGWGVCLLLALLTLGVARNLGYPTDTGEDRTWYLRLATDQFVRPPFVWRIGIAEIAQRWPLGVHEGFRFFHVLSLLMIAVCAFELLRDRFPARPTLAWVGVGLLFSIPVFSQHLPEDIYRVDLPSLAVMFGCALAYVKRQWVLLVFLALLGATVRETSPLMAAALCFALRPGWMAGLPLVGLASYIAIRLAIPVSYSPNFGDVIRYRIANFSPGEGARQYVLGPIGLALLACFPFMAWHAIAKKSPVPGSPARRFLPLVPLVLVALLQILSGSDTARLLLPMSVAVWLVAVEWTGRWIDSPKGLYLGASLALIGAAIPIGHLEYKAAIPLIAGWLLAFVLVRPELMPLDESRTASTPNPLPT